MFTVRTSMSFLLYMSCKIPNHPISPTLCHLRWVRNVRSIRGIIKSRQVVNDESATLSDHQQMSPETVAPVSRTNNADYDYFRRLSSDVSKVSKSHLRSEDTTNEAAVGVIPHDSDDSLSPSPTTAALKAIDQLDLTSVTPALPKKSFNLAPFVNDSEVLSSLVKMGVDLSKLEQEVDVAEHVVKMDFEKEVKPVLLFLHHNGVNDDDIGTCITKNPHLMVESLDNMQVRVNYLEAKKFTKEGITRIITMEPHLLTTPTKQIDAQLGYLQKDFMLSGDEVRQVVTKFPKIAVWSKTSIKDIRLTLKEFLGFSELELKQMLIMDPKIFVSGKRALSQRFDYLHNVIGFSHEDIVRWPRVLRTRTPIVRQRHEFLKFVGRAQFDSKTENYVSPKALVLGRDVEFCENVAKVPVKQFNEFLKTL